MKYLLKILMIFVLFTSCSKTNQKPTYSNKSMRADTTKTVRIYNLSPGCGIINVNGIKDWNFGFDDLLNGQKTYGYCVNGANGHTSFENSVGFIVASRPEFKTWAFLYKNSSVIDSLEIIRDAISSNYFFNSHKFVSSDTITIFVYTPIIYMFE